MVLANHELLGHVESLDLAADVGDAALRHLVDGVEDNPERPPGQASSRRCLKVDLTTGALPALQAPPLYPRKATMPEEEGDGAGGRRRRGVKEAAARREALERRRRRRKKRTWTVDRLPPPLLSGRRRSPAEEV